MNNETKLDVTHFVEDREYRKKVLYGMVPFIREECFKAFVVKFIDITISYQQQELVTSSETTPICLNVHDQVIDLPQLTRVVFPYTNNISGWAGDLSKFLKVDLYQLFKERFIKGFSDNLEKKVERILLSVATKNRTRYKFTRWHKLINFFFKRYILKFILKGISKINGSDYCFVMHPATYYKLVRLCSHVKGANFCKKNLNRIKSI